MIKLNLFDGNDRRYSVDLPKLVIHGAINELALERIANNTDLIFKEINRNQWEAQPTDCSQIVRLLLTYNYKTKYYNNLSFKNELHLKSDHYVGYHVDSICRDCAEYNKIDVAFMQSNSRLSS